MEVIDVNQPKVSHANAWSSIDSVPKDGSIVRLRDEKQLYNCVMSYDRKLNLWVGMAYGVLGASRTYWDESFCPIFEWQHIS